MSRTISLLEGLLSDESVSAKEHVMETASQHVSNVQERLDGNFETIVRELTVAWGDPEFNTYVEVEVPPEKPGDETKIKKNIVPSWSNGTAKNGGDPKALRLCYWRRDGNTFYVVTRVEMDKERDRPLYYEVAIGARKKADMKGNERLRHAKPSVWETIRSWFTG